MKKISPAQLKKSILAVEANRAKYPQRFGPDRGQRARLQKSRQASDKMLAGFLKQSGLDLKNLQANEEKRGAELKRMVAKHKADALKVASRRKGTLYSSVTAQNKASAKLASLTDFFPHPTFTLDTPFLIWSIPLIDIADSAALPFGSWAKVDLKTSQSVTQKVGFYFYWRNPYSDYALINAATSFSATGHLTAHAPWSLGGNSCFVEAQALMNLWSGWPTAVTSSTYASAYLGSIVAVTGFFSADTEGTSISSGVSLSTTLFIVAPGDTVVFEVALSLECDNDGCSIDADFASGNFQISCPVVVFSLVNSPAGSMT
jgi:hypothetical protein